MTLVVDSEMASNAGFGVNNITSTPISSPQTFSFTNTSGTVLYLYVCLGVKAGASSSLGTVSYGGQAMTNVLEQTTAGGESRIGLFRLLNPPTGSNTVSIGFSMPGIVTVSGDQSLEAGAISFTGNDTSTPEKQSTGANGSGTTASVSLSGVSSGNITIAATGAGSNMTAQTQTLSWSINQTNGNQLGNQRGSKSSSTGSVTHSYTIAASDSWAAIAIEVAAASSVPPPPPTSRPLLLGLTKFNPLRRLFIGFPSRPVAPAGAVRDLGTATINGSSTVTASVVKTAVLAPTVNGSSTVTATVVKTAVLTPTVNGSSTVTATLGKSGVISATVNGSSTVTATVVATRLVQPATINGSSTVTATVVVVRKISATINGVTTVTGTVVKTAVLPITINAGASVSATVTGSTTPAPLPLDAWLLYRGHHPYR